MARFVHCFNRRLTSDRFDRHLGKIACWAASLGILTLGLLKLTSLQLSEVQLFFGILLILAVSFQFMILGLLLPMAEAFKGSSAKKVT